MLTVINNILYRRYGVVEGRFCFEGGSHCGKGEGLHLLITDQAQDITDAFDQAAHGNLSLQRPSSSRTGTGKFSQFLFKIILISLFCKQ